MNLLIIKNSSNKTVPMDTTTSYGIPSLWKKESNRENALYVDLFAGIEKSAFLKEWDRKLKSSDFKTVFYHEEYNPGKNNRTSDCFRRMGKLVFNDKKWFDAMEFYSAMLCFAEPGTQNESLAYANRAACFMSMKKCDECLSDIELAVQANYPNMPKLKQRKAKCELLMQGAAKKEKCDLKLSFEAGVNIPCLANVLEIQQNEVFGRHVIAKCDIDVGKTVLIEKAYVSLGAAPDRYQCYTCVKETANFIACPKCTDVMFCNEECRKQNIVHEKFCGESINRMPPWIRFVIESLLLGIIEFSSANEMMSFVEETLANRSTHILAAINDSRSKYRQFLSLASTKNKDCTEPANTVFSGCLSVPSIREMFRSKESQRFLMHLAAEHCLIIETNSFGISLPNSCKSTTIALHKLSLIMSLFNHSCHPNIFNTTSDDDDITTVFTTSRPIKKGEQLFISYCLGKTLSTEMRKAYLSEGYDFFCKCDKCEPHCKTSDRSKMQSDPNFRFLESLSEHEYSLPSVKEKCEALLREFGQLPWSEEIELVTYIYNPFQPF